VTDFQTSFAYALSGKYAVRFYHTWLMTEKHH